jgi:hypothetical protein
MASLRGRLAPLPETDHRLPKTTTVGPSQNSNPLINALADKSRNFPGKPASGFALVVAVMLMVLLTVVAVGMLGLSAISLRASTQSQAIAVARANAKLGIMLALGELQASLGPDRSVSASAAAVIQSPAQPHLTGAWESWRWDPAQSPTPDYAEKRLKFRRWLVSAAPQDAGSFNFPSQAPKGETVMLVSDRQDAEGQSTRLQAAKVVVNSPQGRGASAWAVFDESAKAAVDLADPATAMDAAREVASRTAPNRFRADVIDPQKLEQFRKPANFLSLETANVPAAPANHGEIRRRFHDLTTGTLGLLTDTASGGLKQDLSVLLSPSTFNAQLFDSTGTPYETVSAGAPRWAFLHSHYQKFRDPGMTMLAGGPAFVQRTSSLKPNTTGMTAAPTAANLLPSIAKLQVVFSLVTHPETRPERLAGAPTAKWNQYAIPMLVYEAVITLHNPYDVALKFDKLRFRVWNPPVGFRIAKVSNGVTAWLRKEWQDDPNSFHGLGRFSRPGQDDTQKNIQRFFTVHLSDGKSDGAGNQLLLQPGEVKVFSARVEKDWRWGWEWGWKPRQPWQFLDWFAADDLAGAGNRDLRTGNSWGVEAVPGWALRAGLQMNHLSMEGGGVTGQRPGASFYPFEDKGYWYKADPIIHFDDELLVQLRPEKTTGTGVQDAFRVDLLAAKNNDSSNFLNSQDVLRSYRFRFNNPTEEISADPKKTIIERKFKVGDILQTLGDATEGGKKPMAMLEMTARTTKDELDDSKAWAFNNPVVEGGEIFTNQVGLANQSHDLRLIEMTGWSSFPTIEWDAAKGEGTPGFGRGYFGASRTSSEGVTNVPMYRVAIAPAASLGDWIPANLVAGSQLPRVVHAFGNARAHPLIPSAGVVNTNLAGRRALDHSYFLNDALWDRYYFSSVADSPALPWLGSQARTWQQELQDLIEQRKPVLNARMTPILPTSQAAPLVASLASLGEKERSREFGRYLAVRGPFNLNSTSVDAWRAVLSSLRDQTITGWGQTQLAHAGQAPFARMAMPLASPNQTTKDVNLLGQIRWAGFRTLDDAEITKLAREIVKQIRERGKLDQAPPLTLAEFVNRRVAAPGELHSLTGLLQTAIDQSGINAASHAMDSKKISAATMNPARKRGVATPEAMDGFTGEGAPSILTQGDLLAALAPIATVRGDTFKIRAYGESKSRSGAIEATAWCEAVVQRVPDYVDPTNTPATTTASLNQANKVFGRRFQIVSFRWLAPDEV